MQIGGINKEVVIHELVESFDDMVKSGEEVLNDPAISETIKNLVRTEIANHKRCLSMLGIIY